MITLYNGNQEIVLPVTDDSYSYNAVMGENSMTLYFSSEKYIEIPIGSYCDFGGERYSLKKDSNFTKQGTRNFEYTLLLETDQADLKLWKIRNPVDNRIKFSYTATPREHLELFVANANRRSSGWSVGACIDGKEVTFEYNHTYIFDGLNDFASQLGTEWQIKNKTIHLRKVEYNKENPLILSYGKGNGFKTGVARETGNAPVEILLVQGTDKNIDFSKYGAKELLLPKSQTLDYEGRTYITSADGLSVMNANRPLTTSHEDSLDCSEIYPSREGTVGSVIVVDAEKNFYDFIDSSIPDDLNFEDYLIEGENMTIIFQTGMLASREFEVKYYHEPKTIAGKEKAGKRFEIVPQELDGITMPDGSTFTPQPGDTYAVFGIQLPDAYICDNPTKTGASWDMFREAAKYLYEHEDKQFTFNGTLDGIWAKKRWSQIGGKIVLGGYVNFSDKQFHPQGSLIRMVGIKRYVNKPYMPEIELSNTTSGGSISSDLNKPGQNEVVIDDKYKDSLRFTKRRFRDAKETMQMLEDALLNFSGAINPIAIQTMQLLVGDESLQFRFVMSKANPVQVSHNITYDETTRVLHVPGGLIQHMTLDIKILSSSHKTNEYKFWQMEEYNSASLVDEGAKYYLYAKVSKTEEKGTFLLSETAIKMEQISGYYHLLVGILNSEYDGSRSFVELYGFTEILPGRITTERIVSPSGTTYFDLIKEEIGGKIKFAAGSSGLENLDEWAEVSKDISAANDSANKANKAVENLNDYVDGAFADGIITEAEAKAIEKYINVVNSAKADVEATYTKLYSNVYLIGTPKTNLLNAKVTFMGAVDDLLKAINDAISDQKTTEAEKKNVDAKYAAFNTAYSSMSQAIEAANKAIQDTLKGYSDEALQAAKDAAKAAADAANSAGEANKAIGDLGDYVDGAFSDGIIEESEAKAIEKYINTVNATKSAVEATYAKLYANAYLSGTPKTNLLNAKVTLFGAISNLITSINTAIKDGKTTVEEKKDVDSKFATFNSAYASFNTAVEAANKAIQDTLKGYFDEALQAAKDAAKAAADAANSAGEANKAIGDLGDYVDGAFSDGIIEESEAKAIEKYINTVNATKSAVEATYAKLYANAYLSGTPKTNLLNAKVTLFGAISNLITSINTAIKDGKTTVEEKKDVDSKFATFNSAYASFNTAVEAANKAIQDTLKGYFDEAKDYTDEISLTLKDNVAKNLGYTNYAALEKDATAGKTIINGGKINTVLIEAAALVTSQLLADVINGNGLKIGEDKFVVTIDENKKASVSIKGHVEAESGTFKGRIEANEGVFYGSVAVPPQEIANNKDDLTLSFKNGFNFAGLLSNGVKKIFLPTTVEYSGVECSIVNYGAATNGYYEIKTVPVNTFLYSGTPKNRNTINSIKLYGTSQLKLKAIKVSGSIRWFIENYTEFSFDYINSCLTNGIPSQMARCLGSYWMASQSSLVVKACNDGNAVKFSSYNADGHFSFAFTKSRASNRDYTIIVRNESGNNCPYRISNKTSSGFTIDFNFQYVMGIEGVATVYVDSGNWGFDIFEFDT